MKYSGVIGVSFYDDMDDEGFMIPGASRERIEEKHYVGDVKSLTIRTNESGEYYRELTSSFRVSMVASPYFLSNLSRILFVEVFGTNYSVNSIEVKYPRIIIYTGAVYNGYTSNQ